MRKKVLSLILAGSLVLGIAAVASAHQSLTMDAVSAADNGNLNLRWEPHYGRMIIGFGIINEEVDCNQPYQGTTEVSGIELLFGGRKYLSQLTKKGDNFSGVFFEGDLAVQSVDMKFKGDHQHDRDDSKDQTYTTVTGLVGYKFIAGQNKKSGLTVEVAAGPRFNFGDEFYGYKEDSTEAVAMINLGYTW
ncbi:MAG TPA: hypothetical protein VEC37_12425 [Bacillota bacterium]|nr:hypothetical protein [Bacillota bacterium]